MSRTGQPDLFRSEAQPDLFGAQAAPAYRPDPRHIRNRLVDMLAVMQAAESWPWEAVMVKLYRGTVWPYLYERLPDRIEADGWRQRIEAEIARLDAATA